MTPRKSRIWSSLAGLALAAQVMAQSQTPLGFSDLAGWWSADPVHGGESSHLALQFLEKDGKQQARLSVPAIGGYDIDLGEVSITGLSLDTKALSFPLTWNPDSQTLSGHIPAAAAPIYNIAVEFKRGSALEKPAVQDWRAPRPSLRWSVETGAPVWAGIERDTASGMLFVGNEQGLLQALDREGKVLWKFETGKAIRGQPKVLGSYVYVASDSGYLHKLQRMSGAEEWRARVDLGSEPRIPANEPGTRWDRYGSSVVSDGKRLFYASRDKQLYALELATGRVLWRSATGDIMTATPALHRGLVIFGAYDGKVSAVSAEDGAMRWSYDARLAVSGDLVVAGNHVLLGSRSYDLIALDPATGRQQWKRYYWFSWIESPPAVRDGVVYTGSSDATHVYARNLTDGSLRWKTAVPGYSWQRTAVDGELVIAGTVGAGAFPGTRAGSLVALDRATGAIRWIHLEPPAEEVVMAKRNWGFAASPVIADGVVYAADLNGRVYAFDAQ